VRSGTRFAAQRCLGKDGYGKDRRSCRTAYRGFASLLNRLQSPLLLAIRLYWGWQFAQDGWGKLTHLDKVTQFFASLNLACARHHRSAGRAGRIRRRHTCFACGLASRLTVSLVLFVNMTMAYLSVPDDRSTSSHIFSKPDDFYGASPYTYWFAALLILILGPGLVCGGLAAPATLRYAAKSLSTRYHRSTRILCGSLDLW
jgi:putative oxidoreductase